MFRVTRPLFQQVLKTTTGLTGVPVHPNPLPALLQTYRSTLEQLKTLPESSVYRQGIEALTKQKISIVEKAKEDVAAVEQELDEGQIEESIKIAEDELKLAVNMLEWKSWEPLEEKPQPGQWEYPGVTSS